MSKHWTEKEDIFLHAYFDAVGDPIGPMDFGRPVGSAAKRAKFLKETGAWSALTRMDDARCEYLRLANPPSLPHPLAGSDEPDAVAANAASGSPISEQKP